MGGITSVAGLIPAITGATSVINSVDSAVSSARNIADPYAAEERYRKQLKASQDLALKQLQDRQAAEISEAEADTAAQRAQMQAETATTENARVAALKRAVARQKVSFASQGIASGDGSGQAVMLGLFDESEQEKKDREKFDSIKASALDQGLADRRRRNVLELTQLQEQQNLQRLYS